MSVSDEGPALTGTRRLPVGEVELDLDGVLVRVAGERVALTYREFLVLRVLMENAGRVVSREDILQAAWEPPRPRRRMVDVYVRRVRGRLGDTEQLEDHIRTVRGQGYVFDIPRPVSSVHLPRQRGLESR
jgi:DNA-binding response OmpR family regulator